MVTDAMLTALARWAPRPLRLRAARKAAERGLHWIALRAAGDDPYVLAALGLFPLARDGRGSDRRAAFGRLVAEAAMTGKLGPEFEASSLDHAEQRRIAAALAPGSPEMALRFLPSDIAAERAACLVAATRTDEVAAALGDAEGRDASLIRAHIALSKNDNRAGRAAWNAAFAADGLAPPLALSDRPVSAEAFSSAAGSVRDGPLISIVVPYRDARGTIGHALESLLAQSWRAMEILAIDDHSDDDGPAVVRDMAMRDARIVPLANDGTPGVYGARNRALKRATGEFVTFLDADDWSPPERLERQADRLAAGAAVAIANHVRIDDTGRPIAPRVFPIARPVPITLMMRREALLAAGPFEEVVTGADSEMLGRLQMRFGRAAIARDKAILLVARWRPGSLSEAREGGLFGAERLAYRADWMFRHAGLTPPLASLPARGLETADKGRKSD